MYFIVYCKKISIFHECIARVKMPIIFTAQDETYLVVTSLNFFLFFYHMTPCLGVKLRHALKLINH